MDCQAKGVGVSEDLTEYEQGLVQQYAHIGNAELASDIADTLHELAYWRRLLGDESDPRIAERKRLLQGMVTILEARSKVKQDESDC